jgi:hypothetical protein
MQLNMEMIRANAGINVRHNWESWWYVASVCCVHNVYELAMGCHRHEWPLNLRGILYYSKDMGHTYTSTIYLLGE